MKVIVYHSYLGCETGCCGHAVEFEDGSRREFGIGDHPYDGDDPRKFAEDLIREKFGEEHVADLDWENSEVVVNC